MQAARPFLAPEEVEYQDMEAVMETELAAQHAHAERVIASRPEANGATKYLVKVDPPGLLSGGRWRDCNGKIPCSFLRRRLAARIMIRQGKAMLLYNVSIPWQHCLCKASETSGSLTCWA